MEAGHGHEVAAEVEAAVRATPGVTNVYRAGSLLTNAVDAGVRALGARDGDLPLVLVQRVGEGLRLQIAIGVDAASRATATTRAAYLAARAVLTARELGDADVLVTVVHVHEASGAAATAP